MLADEGTPHSVVGSPVVDRTGASPAARDGDRAIARTAAQRPAAHSLLEAR